MGTPASEYTAVGCRMGGTVCMGCTGCAGCTTDCMTGVCCSLITVDAPPGGALVVFHFCC